jgi:DNA-binding NarL/FixJ family response regulator
MFLNHKTIETYRHRIMVKLNIHTVADLTKYAVVKGLVEAK